MKKDEVKIGGLYLAKVTNKIQNVRIDAESRHGGWDATNVGTGKKIRVKSAQRLRGPVVKSVHSAFPTPDTTTSTIDAGGGIMVDIVERPAATLAAKTPKAPKEKKGKKVSGLDGAALVLAKSGEPMSAQAIVDEMAKKGIWSSTGKTPAATIYSAMLREIDAKPGDARFEKVGKNQFAATKKAKAAAV